MATAPRPREPYRFPFATLGEGLAFVAGTPGGADAAAAYCRLYRGADYLRWANGGTITTERITCRSGGLSIRGLLVRPRTPGPHPVPILHGGGDPRVEPTDALRMATALQRLTPPYRLNIHEGGAHDLIADLGDVRAAMDRWSDRYVGDLTPPPANAAVPLADAS